MLLWSVLACKKVEPAPAALDDLFHWFWREYDEGDDPTLAEGLVNLHEAVDGETLEESFEGTVSDLSKPEVTPLGMEADPARAAGVFIVNVFACEWHQLEEILSFGQQDELYTGVYESYGRDFVGSRDAWLAGDTDRLAYELTYTSSVLGAHYTATSNGALRRVSAPGDPEEGDPRLGRFVVQRSYMPHPGAFEEGSEKSMDQDYQLEIYWSPEPGRILHAYAMWRQADWGSGMDSDHPGAQRILLNNLLQWDGDTERLCEEGRP